MCLLYLTKCQYKSECYVCLKSVITKTHYRCKDACEKHVYMLKPVSNMAVFLCGSPIYHHYGYAWTQLRYLQSVRCSHRPTTANCAIHGHGELPGAVHASPDEHHATDTTCSRMTCLRMVQDSTNVLRCSQMWCCQTPCASVLQRWRTMRVGTDWNRFSYKMASQ